MIWYLAQKYTGIEDEAIEFAHEMKNELYKMGYTLYSPINDSHYHAKWLKKRRNTHFIECPNCKLSEMFEDVECENTECPKCGSELNDWWGSKVRYPEPDWVAEDIKFMEGFLSDDVCIEGGNNAQDCSCHGPATETDCKDYQKYDSNLTILFADSCFDYNKPTNNLTPKKIEKGFSKEYNCETTTKTYDGLYFFDSKGAKKEYLWAKKNHVRCLKLEEFLKGNEVEI